MEVDFGMTNVYVSGFPPALLDSYSPNTDTRRAIVSAGHRIIAPQAQLEESANDRSKPEVLISRVLKRDPLLVLGITFEGFCDWYLTFSCPKPGHISHPNRTRYVCQMSVLFLLSAPFSSRSMAVRLSFQKKSLKKRGPARHATPRWTVFWSGTTFGRPVGPEELDDVGRQDL